MICRLTRRISKHSNFSSLSTAQKLFYKEQGFLLVEKVIPESSISRLLERTDQIIENADIVKDQIFFKADNASQRGINFLDTASEIGFLLEEGVLDQNKNLKVPTKKQALNKIGHAMHDLDTEFRRFSYNKIIQGILGDLGYIDPILTQSMLIFKNQKLGSKVDMHTDNTYIITRPRLSCMGLWIALEDATISNGCMYAFPGSHRVQTDYFLVMQQDRKSTHYIGNHPNYEEKYDKKHAACLEVPRGTVIALHGDLVHYSGHNSSPISRHAYTMHFIETANGNRWSEENWLQRVPSLPFRKYNEVVNQLDL